jgi:hypothetical protein
MKCAAVFVRAATGNDVNVVLSFSGSLLHSVYAFFAFDCVYDRTALKVFADHRCINLSSYRLRQE